MDALYHHYYYNSSSSLHSRSISRRRHHRILWSVAVVAFTALLLLSSFQTEWQIRRGRDRRLGRGEGGGGFEGGLGEEEEEERSSFPSLSSWKKTMMMIPSILVTTTTDNIHSENDIDSSAFIVTPPLWSPKIMMMQQQEQQQQDYPDYQDRDLKVSKSPHEKIHAFPYKQPPLPSSFLNEMEGQHEGLLPSHVSVLSLGTGVTWGADLEDRHTQAFPYLLSHCRSTNVAIYGEGPTYPSLCLESMVDDHNNDNEFDVVTLEFFHKAPRGLIELSLRVRERYPNALLIFLELWRPMDLHRREINTGEAWEKLGDWAARMGYPEGMHNAKFLHLLRNDGTDGSDVEWVYPPYQEEHKTVRLAARATDGIIFRLPMRPDTQPDPRNSVLAHHHWFDDKFVHLNAAGHAYVARALTDKVQEYLHNKNNNLQSKLPSVVGTWGKGDFCHNWYTTGTRAFLEKHVRSSDNMPLMEYDLQHHLWALEVPSVGQIAVLYVYNPFIHEKEEEEEEYRDLFISIMTARDSRVFPTTMVTIMSGSTAGAGKMVSDKEQQQQQQKNTVTWLHPYITDSSEGIHHSVHAPKTVWLGKVAAKGWNTLSFESLEHKQLPLRIVGVNIAND